MDRKSLLKRARKLYAAHNATLAALRKEEGTGAETTYETSPGMVLQALIPHFNKHKITMVELRE
jgi:deoxycytidylate deaminase